MRFQVPQFIEVEDKIFGPLTFKQFVYLAGAAGVTIVSFVFLPKFFALLVSAPFVVLGVSLAFYKINNRPFIYTVESFFKYIIKERLYIWKKEEGVAKGSTHATEDPMVYIPKLGDSKLKDLSWSIDVTKGTESEESLKDDPRP